MYKDLVEKAPIITLIILCGFFLGQLSVRISSEPITLRKDERLPSATVQLLGIQNNQLIASVHGDVRFFIGDHQLFESGGIIIGHAGPLLKNEQLISIPSGMQFVASAKGSKFYPVESSSAMNIVPQNRIYFRSAQEAIAAGYKK